MSGDRDVKAMSISEKIKTRREKRKKKKEKREAKWNDPYGIEGMDDSIFAEKQKSLLIRGILRTILGILILAGVFAVLVLFWDRIFYSGVWFI